MADGAEKISVTVTPAMKRLLDQRVAAGEFASASELVREALRQWQKQDRDYKERISAVRKSITRSISDPRPSITANEARSELGRYAARRASKK